MNLKSAFAAAALALAGAMLPVTAHAVTYYFTQDGSGGTLGGNIPVPGYGSVTVTTVGSDLEFDIALAPNWSVDTGSHHAVAFALATSGLAISGTSGPIATPLAVPFVQNPGPGPFSNPGFAGPFNYAIECSGGGNGQNSCNGISSLTFFVLGAGSLSPILTNGVFVTADIYSEGTGKTGVVGATAPVPGPIVGAGLPGLLGAMGALVMLARRRRRNALS